MTSNTEITILQINDTHGYFELHKELYWAGKKEKYHMAGGYARIANIFRDIKEEKHEKVVCLDNGDTIHGTFPAVNSRGHSLVPILNELNLDAMTAHWEFAYGPQNFKDLIKKLKFPVLAINCYEKNSNKLFFSPFHLKEIDNLRIGIIGIAATIVDKTMPKHFSEGIFLTLGKKELPFYINELRENEKVDLIIVLSHLGYPQELQLSKEVDGIDVLLSGHTHNRIYEPAIVNNTIIIQSGCHGSFVGRLDLEVKNGRVHKFQHKLIDVNESIKPDLKVQSIIDRTLDKNLEMLNMVVGETKTNLHRYLVMETTMDNLLLDAIKEVSGEKIAFSNGWRYGAPIEAGPILKNDLWNIIPTNPKISICKITGKELWVMMEENLERTFSCDPYKQMGGYVKRCSGVNVYFKIENPFGKRIQDFFVNGKRLNKSKVYTACFVTSQGIPENYGKERYSLDIRAMEAIEKIFEKNKAYSTSFNQSIVPF